MRFANGDIGTGLVLGLATPGLPRWTRDSIGFSLSYEYNFSANETSFSLDVSFGWSVQSFRARGNLALASLRSRPGGRYSLHMAQQEQRMGKQVGDYILDCLRALNKDEMEVELANRIREIRLYWEQLWGGAVPQDERVFAAFISNDAGSREPKDLWYFTKAHCLVAKDVTAGKLDLLIYSFKDGIKRMRIAKNYGEQPPPGARLVVGLWFDDESKAVIEAADGNCLSLETLIEEVLVPRLQ